MFGLKNQVHEHVDTQKEDVEFDFWGSHQVTDDDNSSHNFATYCKEDYFHDFSPTLWKTKNASKDVESSPLLRHDYHNYDDQISPPIWSQAIAEGRKELMEMIREMPETSYELSLKDLVDEKREVKQEEVVSDQEASFRFYSNNDQSKQPTSKKSKSIHKSVQMSRSGSMEKETFLIKMFIPTSLSWKKKLKPEKPSRFSSSLPFDKSDNHISEDWSIKRLLVSGKGKDSRSSSNSSSSSSNSSTSRLCRHSKSPGCWSFICIKKSKDRECIF